MKKIEMNNPLVEMDGDEMTRILWKWIKDELILPFVDLKTVYFDLGLKHRDETGDQVTIDAAEAALEYGVAVKCATITPNTDRQKEYDLKEIYRSPNGTIRAIMDGTVFRKPIIVKGIEPVVRNWKRPITIARHAYGDVYRDQEIAVNRPGRVSLKFTPCDGGEPVEIPVFDFEGNGIAEGIYNTDDSIRNFARSCFEYALSVKEDLWFSTKDTISKKYDQRFKDIFKDEYDHYKDEFEKAGITYFYTLIDDAAARIMRSEGGFIWALKNYDGDVMSDLISSASGSLAMMTSVLVNPDGKYEYEAAHGTVQRHYYKYLRGEKTSTNPTATIFAWTGALRKRGEMDSLPELINFSDMLEKACLDTISDGKMTGDLVRLTTVKNPVTLTSEEFIKTVRGTLMELLGE
jgi:isocitrate dehydrogenase